MFLLIFFAIPEYMKVTEHPRDCAEENKLAYTVTRISASDCTSAAIWGLYKGVIYVMS